jgi:RND family efflux transporter MFP subunit
VIRWLLLLVVLGAAAAWLLVNRPWEPKPTIVAVEIVTPGWASRALAINGRIVPANQVEISSTVNGRIISVAVEEGNDAAAGSAMLVIDDVQQRSAVVQARSQLAAAEAQRDKAQSDLERAEALRDSVSRKALDDARLALETAQKEVDRQSSMLDQEEDLLAQYTIRAPFDGTILSRGADPGQVVSSSTPLFLFADLTTLYGEASVDELYASEVRRGLAVAARPAGHSDTIEGEVVYVSPRVDASTGGRLVKVGLPGAGGLNLPVGLTVMLNIVVDQRENVITIPRGALVAGDRPAVYVIENGKAVLRAVQYIDWPSDRLILTEGLSGGEALILDSKLVKAEGALVAAGQ